MQAESSGGTSLTFVAENLGEAEPGMESPSPDLSGMQFVAGGYYAAFSKSAPHTVMFSDIGNVTSWPVAYRYDVKDNIVALATTSNSVFALTDGWPWVLSGTAPESMTVAKLAGPAACVSPRGVLHERHAEDIHKGPVAGAEPEVVPAGAARRRPVPLLPQRGRRRARRARDRPRGER